MLAANYTTVRENLKAYCDKATDEDETVVVTRKNDKNVVLISLNEWSRLSKAAKNMEYLNMLDNSFEQLRSGKGVQHELIEESENTR